MIIPVVIFTFNCDHICTLVAAQSAMDAGLGPVYVYEDMKAKLPEGTADELRKMGCKVERTHFNRFRNLRGMKTYRGMLDVYCRVLGETGADHLVKLDADTYIINAERIKQAAADGVACAGMTHGSYLMYGWCYLLSRKLVFAINNYQTTHGEFPGWSSDSFPEDRVTASIAQHLGIGEVRLWPYDPEGGYGAGYAYSRAKIFMERYAEIFDVVTFGNRHLIPGNKSSCAKRDDVAATMLHFNRICHAA